MEEPATPSDASPTRRRAVIVVTLIALLAGVAVAMSLSDQRESKEDAAACHAVREARGEAVLNIYDTLLERDVSEPMKTALNDMRAAMKKEELTPTESAKALAIVELCTKLGVSLTR